MARERRPGPRAKRAQEEQAAQSAHDTQQLVKWIGLALLMGCVGIAIYAWRETTVSQGASAQPVPGDLAEIEATSSAPDLHLRLGRHLALYPAAVFRYELERFETESVIVPDGTEIDYCLYPVISEKHPVLAALEDGSSERALGGGPDIENIALLVKTERFAIVREIPKEAAWAGSIQGLVINRIRKLSDEETRLIRESLPSVDLSSVLILEEGRSPTSGQGSAMLFILAALCGGTGVGCLVFWKRLEAAERRRRRREAQEAAPEERRAPRGSRRSPGRRSGRRR